MRRQKELTKIAFTEPIEQVRHELQQMEYWSPHWHALQNVDMPENETERAFLYLLGVIEEVQRAHLEELMKPRKMYIKIDRKPVDRPGKAGEGDR